MQLQRSRKFLLCLTCLFEVDFFYFNSGNRRIPERYRYNTHPVHTVQPLYCTDASREGVEYSGKKVIEIPLPKVRQVFQPAQTDWSSYSALSCECWANVLSKSGRTHFHGWGKGGRGIEATKGHLGQRRKGKEGVFLRTTNPSQNVTVCPPPPPAAAAAPK